MKNITTFIMAYVAISCSSAWALITIQPSPQDLNKQTQKNILLQKQKEFDLAKTAHEKAARDIRKTNDTLEKKYDECNLKRKKYMMDEKLAGLENLVTMVRAKQSLSNWNECTASQKKLESAYEALKRTEKNAANKLSQARTALNVAKQNYEDSINTSSSTATVKPVTSPISQPGNPTIMVTPENLHLYTDSQGTIIKDFDPFMFTLHDAQVEKDVHTEIKQEEEIEKEDIVEENNE